MSATFDTMGVSHLVVEECMLNSVFLFFLYTLAGMNMDGRGWTRWSSSQRAFLIHRKFFERLISFEAYGRKETLGVHVLDARETDA